MKEILSIVFILAIVTNSFSQKDSSIAPYKRFPTVPPLRLLAVDSSVFTKDDLEKNRPVLVMLFSPACDHCQHETEEIIKNIGSFKKIRIVMASTASFNEIKEFYVKYELEKYPAIKVGQDTQFLLPSFYMIRNLPFLAMYDKKGKLLTTFEGVMKIEDMLGIFK